MSGSSGFTCLGIAVAAACVTVLAEPPVAPPPVPAATADRLEVAAAGTSKGAPDGASLAERLLQANPRLTQAEIEAILATPALSAADASQR